MLVLLVVLKHQSCSKMNIAWYIFENKNKSNAIVLIPCSL